MVVGRERIRGGKKTRQPGDAQAASMLIFKFKLSHTVCLKGRRFVGESWRNRRKTGEVERRVSTLESQPGSTHNVALLRDFLESFLDSEISAEKQSFSGEGETCRAANLAGSEQKRSRADEGRKKGKRESKRKQ